MLPDQVARYEKTRQNILEDYDKIMASIDKYDPYVDGETQEILDTDYENYLFMYTCKQSEVMLNIKGQSKSEVEQLKVDFIQRKRYVGQKAKRKINSYLNTFGANANFVKFVETIQR